MSLNTVFDQLADIIGICPSCGHLFRVADTRPHLKTQARVTLLDGIEAEEAKLDRALERLEAQEATLRDQARAQGLKQAKRKLRALDRVFSAARLDPHDVKVIFDPVEYVVFDGMNRDKLRRVLLLCHAPANIAEERVSNSIDDAIRAGNYVFKTLRVAKDGSMALQ